MKEVIVQRPELSAFPPLDKSSWTYASFESASFAAKALVLLVRELLRLLPEHDVFVQGNQRRWSS
jgi:hypothetical protein